MTIIKSINGEIYFKFYRKHYKKARYRKWAQRIINQMDKDFPGWSGLIIY